MQRAIIGLCVAWKPLIAPQAIVMKRHGKIGCPLTPTEGPMLPIPSQNSGIEGQRTSRPTKRETAMNSSEKANSG